MRRSCSPHAPALHARLAGPLCALALLSAAGPAFAGATLGFIERFPGTSTNSWTGGSQISNPGTGGVDGAGDGYILISTLPVAGKLGAYSDGPWYAGDWTAAGITQVQLWLNDVNAPQPLEIHFSLGNSALGNFWQYNVGFVPVNNVWTQFTVDLTNATNFTKINTGTGTFAQALAAVDKIHVRHDLAPFTTQAPNTIAGDFGLDDVLLTDGTASVGPRPGAASPLKLAPPAPNPSRGPVALRMDVPGGAVHIQIVDVTGRILRHAELPDAGAGPRIWMWDGADDAGRAVAPGAYRARAVGPTGGMSQPLIRIR
jgi:hypothetical protein